MLIELALIGGAVYLFKRRQKCTISSVTIGRWVS